MMAFFGVIRKEEIVVSQLSVSRSEVFLDFVPGKKMRRIGSLILRYPVTRELNQSEPENGKQIQDTSYQNRDTDNDNPWSDTDQSGIVSAGNVPRLRIDRSRRG